MTRVLLLASTVLIAAVNPIAGQEMLDGTWKLVSSKRTTTHYRGNGRYFRP